MTTVTAGQFGSDLIDFHFAEIATQTSCVYHDNAIDVLIDEADQFTLIFQGAGFKAVNGAGFEEKGTVTNFDIWSQGKPFLSFSDFSFSAKSLNNAIAAGPQQVGMLMFSGDDHFRGTTGGVAFAGFAGNDVLDGSTLDDYLQGGTGKDIIRGGNGADHIRGDGGADKLTGGTGPDTFEYRALADSHSGRIDTITDLHNNDIIDLSAIDADTLNEEGDDAFVLVANFTGAPGQLTVHYDHAHNRTVILGDVNGDAVADLTIYATGKHGQFTHFDF